jgi:hypothetical protein
LKGTLYPCSLHRKRPRRPCGRWLLGTSKNDIGVLTVYKNDHYVCMAAVLCQRSLSLLCPHRTYARQEAAIFAVFASKTSKIVSKDWSAIRVLSTLRIYNCHFYKGMGDSTHAKPCMACALLAIQYRVSRCNFWIRKRGQRWQSNAGQDIPGHLSAHCGCGALARCAPAWFVQSRRASDLLYAAVTAVQTRSTPGTASP